MIFFLLRSAVKCSLCLKSHKLEIYIENVWCGFSTPSPGYTNADYFFLLVIIGFSVYLVSVLLFRNLHAYTHTHTTQKKATEEREFHLFSVALSKQIDDDDGGVVVVVFHSYNDHGS